uniref:Uncharacterized protein n=1 Tax=Lotharella oceanica TaxID=641309 RepID=A0A7S2TG37_9EUKA|mmetsp:Transcript_11924/g.22963  ORF Transcript_11924/g.22963 Transcript_11924/m.22963 type:complete len:357 (+) Transcript_11924:193-1263(+)
MDAVQEFVQGKDPKMDEETRKQFEKLSQGALSAFEKSMAEGGTVRVNTTQQLSASTIDDCMTVAAFLGADESKNARLLRTLVKVTGDGDMPIRCKALKVETGDFYASCAKFYSNHQANISQDELCRDSCILCRNRITPQLPLPWLQVYHLGRRLFGFPASDSMHLRLIPKALTKAAETLLLRWGRIQNGADVLLHGLRQDQFRRLNGARAKITGYNNKTGRYYVAFNNASLAPAGNSRAQLNPTNLLQLCSVRLVSGGTAEICGKTSDGQYLVQNSSADHGHQHQCMDKEGSTQVASPSSVILPPGVCARIVGLSNNTHLNGKLATVISWDHRSQRYLARLQSQEHVRPRLRCLVL